MTDLGQLLDSATTIEVIDWPGAEVPATLVRAGYTVVAPRYPPPGRGESAYLLHEVTDGPAVEGDHSFPLEDGSRLTFVPLDELPSVIDIVSTYRPAEEQPGIVGEAISRGARAVWVEPGESVSDAAKEAALAAGLAFVEGISIADAVRDRGNRT